MALVVNNRLAPAPDDALDDSHIRRELPAGVYRQEQPIPDERVELFRAEGLVYTVARRVPPSAVMAYLRDVSRSSEELAVARLMERVLGPATVDALADNPNLTAEEFKAVMQAVQRYTLGATRDLLGK